MAFLSNQFSHINLRESGPAFLVGMGHGATHWMLATFYVVLPFLAKDLSLSYAQAGALVSLFHASAFIANVGSGAIVDIAGKRVIVQALSLVIGALALIAIGFSAGLVGLILPIILIGLTNNLWHPAAISFLSRTFPNTRGFALSIHTLGATFGDMLAPIAVGGLMSVLAWRESTVLSALPVFVIAATLLLTLREGSDAAVKGDTKERSRSYISGVANLLRNRAVIALCLMAGFRSMTQNGLLLFIPLYLVSVLKVGPVTLGFAMAGLQAGGILAGPLAGIWSDRAGRQPIVFICLAATTVAIAGFAFVTSLPAFLALVVILGFALFSVRPVIHSWTMDLADENMAGTAVSVLFGAQTAFTLAVPTVGGLIADEWGLHTVFYMLAATSLIATVITYTLPDVKRA